ALMQTPGTVGAGRNSNFGFSPISDFTNSAKNETRECCQESCLAWSAILALPHAAEQFLSSTRSAPAPRVADHAGRRHSSAAPELSFPAIARTAPWISS